MKFLRNLAKHQKFRNPEPFYNNPGFYDNWKKYEVPEKGVCYKYDRFSKQVVTVMNPQIDTLRFTLDTKDIALRKSIHEQLANIGEDWKPDGKEFSEVKFGKYAKTVCLSGYPSKVYLLAHAVDNTSNRFLQVGIHASSYTASEISRLFTFLYELSNRLWTFNYIYKNSKVLRMDWCIDFKHISPLELGMWKVSGTRGANFFIHKGLGNTGMDIEAKHPNKGNKHKKGKHNASKAYYYDKQHQSPLLSEETTRFEFRTFKEDTSISDNINSGGKKSVFKPYQVLDFATIKPHGFSDHEWLSFGDTCKLRTIDNAISILPIDKQEIAIKTMKSIEERVWRIEELKKAMEKEASRFNL